MTNPGPVPTRELQAARRRLILEAIASHVARHGWPPSVRELSEATGVPTSTVTVDLAVLEAEGRIIRGDGRRCLALADRVTT